MDNEAKRIREKERVMKIEFVGKPKHMFEEIKNGDVFVNQGSAYLKIGLFESSVEGTSGYRVNAIGLRCGSHHFFYHDTPVIKTKSVIKVEIEE